ncbi:MAG: DUF389 domain-containing protein [Candidatus Paceibacterota bacterium]
MKITEFLFKDVSTSVFGQRRTIETLTAESKPDFDFFLFLVFATCITTIGLLRDNAIVIVAGMLLAPLLFPIMALGMGMVTFSLSAIIRALFTIIESIGVVVLISAFTAYFIGPVETNSLSVASTPDILLYVVAFLAGTITAFTWVKQNMSASLPSIAITVALIVPLSAVGIAIVGISPDTFFNSFELFFGNLFAITLATIIVFMMFGFARLHQYQEKVIEAEKKE